MKIGLVTFLSPYFEIELGRAETLRMEVWQNLAKSGPVSSRGIYDLIFHLILPSERITQNCI